ncbi:uncharacterized protein Dere_GG26255 [Drosophila erecta]|uniref:Uncharacterized protein n=1 Tax=Drosophila erecta TaxID=7220 RepID=A0A0Q5VLS8_DROER|nr:uncharacterized protein Dere_GG26255 [Drosophila erecta]
MKFLIAVQGSTSLFLEEGCGVVAQITCKFVSGKPSGSPRGPQGRIISICGKERYVQMGITSTDVDRYGKWIKKVDEYGR